MDKSFYPPSIQGAPPELTVPSGAYRRQVVIVLLSLTLFILLYIGLVVGSGWAACYGIAQGFNSLDNTDPHSNSNSYFVLAVVGAILFLFLVKSLFKWQKKDEELRIEITPAEHPELFSFIRKICEETKAPFPYHVYLTQDVNAAVFYNSSLLSLILPVKKNLLIGLGLVNGLNLSEFKAVLAHEFGHFSQSSMRLGSYVYMANHIVYDLVYHRDVFDDLLAKAKRMNYRIAVFAYLTYGVLWVLRKILQVAFKLINLFQSGLSRQMEYHADLVAVNITGSDSLIHALKRLDFLHACLLQAYRDLRHASEHQLYTQDLYYHQTRAADYLRQISQESEAGKVPMLPEDPGQKTQLFTPEDDDSEESGMWASHPSHYQREQNAKRCYLRSIEDDRSPWLLFHNPEALRAKMTTRFYLHYLDLKSPQFTPAEQVQQFIDDEHAETKQDERYEGMYDGRLLSIPSDMLTPYANDPALPAMSHEQIASLLNKLYNAEYKAWMKAHLTRRKESQLLNALDEGEAKLNGSHFTFREGQYRKSDVKSLLQMVQAELETDSEWLTAFDREVFMTHLRMAQILNEGDQDLYDRYLFHLQLQDMLRTAGEEEFRLQNLFQYLSSKESALSPSEFSQVVSTLTEIRRNIGRAYRKIEAIKLPTFQNMQTGLPFGEYLLQEPLIDPLSNAAAEINPRWMNLLYRQVSQIEERCRRLYFKSMGTILTRQEEIAQNYRTQVFGEKSDPQSEPFMA